MTKFQDNPLSNRYALVNSDGIVADVVIWKGDPYLPREGHSLVHSPRASRGDKLDIKTGVLTKIPSSDGSLIFNRKG